jgi:hypothetical protein
MNRLKAGLEKRIVTLLIKKFLTFMELEDSLRGLKPLSLDPEVKK